MCGIAGIVDFGSRPRGEMEAALDRMQAAIAHRGPDGAGRWTGHTAPGGPSVYFAHHRLAIIDLSPGGHQPKVSSSGTSVVTYNGEIYNYRSLREELELRGHQPRTTSDTEVIVELLARDGGSMLGRLRGMFAFAWWEAVGGRLMLARDRFGIKPLVYTQPAQDLVVFASIPRALGASGLVDLVPDVSSAAEFLARGGLAPDRSYWRHVRAVPPGGSVTFDGGVPEPRAYWSLASVWLGDRPELPVRDVARAVRPALIQSVNAHLVSDVPVAIFLSGGLDSAAILGAARECVTGPLQTFTVTMPGTALDEGREARVTADYFGTDHTEIVVSDVDLDEALNEFFAAMPQPTVDGFNTFLVARAARRAGIRVALSGVGGDEAFGGYPSFAEVPVLQRGLKLFGPAVRALAPVLSRWPSPRATKLAGIARVSPRTTADVWWEYRRLMSGPEVEAITGARFEGRPDVPVSEAATFDVLRYCEWRHFLERQLLADGDAFTMPHALELRTPLVDHVFIDAVASAGRWSRGGDLSYKRVLFRELKGLTVPALDGQPKRGFVLPYDAWLREALTAAAPTRLRDAAARLSRPRYAAFVDGFLRRRVHWSRIWALYVLDRVGL